MCYNVCNCTSALKIKQLFGLRLRTTKEKQQ
jgi:hypothetical protein